jgi:thioredoxin 1
MKHLFAAAPLAAIILAAPAFAQTGAWQAYTKSAFDRAVAAGPVVVHVHADWCPTCRRQQPILQQLTQGGQLTGVQTFTANFDSDKAFTQANRVTTQSTILVFKGGREVARAAGATDPNAIAALVAQAK